ncbi:MAG TPA: hypothetical protein PKD17_01935 [Cellvibrionaceae bacterium]|nr:hypothetical protein [Cellvibrionaceae bacterium]HMW70547.1 hypothetical protein [Cellvibrionaceae bacterium]HNG59834.1 hypothetical protein [Cellvibrionaceae bacterium]
MLDKKAVESICTAIASDYQGWEYSNKTFKNKSLKYAAKIINFGRSYSGLCSNFQPLLGIWHKKLCQEYKKIFGVSEEWISGNMLYNAVPEYRSFNFFTDYTQPGHDHSYMEQMIRGVFLRCAQEIDKIYNFDSEAELIESFPVELEFQGGLKHCLARAYLCDFEFIKNYRLRQLEGVSPHYRMNEQGVDQIIKYYKIPME